MRRRFFVEQFAGQTAVMEGDAAHHLGRVLRAQTGQLYELSDGEKVWLGRIDSVGRDRVQFSLLEQLPVARPSVNVTLFLAVVKFDAFEWAIEKATELGVSTIVPLAAERSEKALLTAAAKRAERWKKILLEASQQSRRLSMPVLNGLAKPEMAFASQKGGLRVMLSERTTASSLRKVLQGQRAASVILAIGPEGGWTDEEFGAASESGFAEASLGRWILRTETAVVTALASLNFALGDD
ncbi:MAG TPA: RsmE family RNA methyltransferase [Candidatus Polarisedimenticolia bacterium]|nr:RsmE family RNA methyltransferase [Candidatus Polarisedimenticolia bacterium]